MMEQKVSKLFIMWFRDHSTKHLVSFFCFVLSRAIASRNVCSHFLGQSTAVGQWLMWCIYSSTVVICKPSSDVYVFINQWQKCLWLYIPYTSINAAVIRHQFHKCHLCRACKVFLPRNFSISFLRHLSFWLFLYMCICPASVTVGVINAVYQRQT